MKREWLKRWMALVLCLLMVASLAACGNKETTNPANDTPPATDNTPDDTPDDAGEPEEPAFVVADNDNIIDGS